MNNGSARTWTVIGILSAVFLLLTLAVAAGVDALDAFDQWIYLTIRGAGLRPAGPPELFEIIRDVTALGSYTVVGLVTGAAFLTLYARGRSGEAWFVLTTVVAGAVAIALLKEIIARPRPDLFEPVHHVASLSYPSGHAGKAALTYLCVGTVLVHLARRASLMAVIWLVAIGTTVAVGLSRIYLGVHWPSDVLGGWLFGLIWVMAAWQLRPRSHVAPPR